MVFVFYFYFYFCVSFVKDLVAFDALVVGEDRLIDGDEDVGGKASDLQRFPPASVSISSKEEIVIF